ncbi:MAG: c-type cytochrome [Gammaproteobacteria bacterium]
MTVKHIFLLVLIIVLAGCAQEDAGAPQEAAGQAAEDAKETAATVADPAEVAARVAAADPENGKRLYIYCQACHTLNSGGPNKVGPNLYGVVNRGAAMAEGFVFSEPLSNSGLVWDQVTLDAWIENPSRLVPGTTMVFGGIKDPVQRANLIAYLEQATQ